MSVIPLYTNDLLDSMRLKGDPPADDLVHRYMAEEGSKAFLYQWLNSSHSNDYLNKLADPFGEEELFQNAKTLPAWADEKMLGKGLRFFNHYPGQILQLLGLLSLPYCYAASNGARVLHFSERLRNDTGKRLSETGQFVIDVQSINTFKKEGKFFISILKTRIIHAIARYYTLGSGKWNKTWGLPVNQEDVAGTQMAFSLIVLRGLRKLGISISNEEQQSYLHLWAVISNLLGLEDSINPRNGKAANHLESKIRARQFQSSPHGIELTASLVHAFTQLDPDNPVTSREVKQFMSYLLGKDIAFMLKINDVSVPVHVPYLLKALSVFSRFKSHGPQTISFNEK